MHIFQEEAGVICDDRVWVCMHDEYIYTADTLEELVKVLNTEWEDDSNLAC